MRSGESWVEAVRASVRKHVAQEGPGLLEQVQKQLAVRGGHAARG